MIDQAKVQARFSLLAQLVDKDSFDLDKALATVDTLVDFIFQDEPVANDNAVVPLRAVDSDQPELDL